MVDCLYFKFLLLVVLLNCTLLSYTRFYLIEFYDKKINEILVQTFCCLLEFWQSLQCIILYLVILFINKCNHLFGCCK